MKDLQKELDDQLSKAFVMLKTDVDIYYDNITGVVSKGNEESKSKKSHESKNYLEKCQKIGKVGPLSCKPALKFSRGTFSPNNGNLRSI